MDFAGCYFTFHAQKQGKAVAENSNEQQGER